MKRMIRSALFLIVFLAAGVVFGAVPPLTVTVSDAAGKVAFKGATNTGGTFATGSLGAGNYAVQFNSTNAAVKGNQYTLVISAGKKKVSANGIAGDKFSAGGVAMKIDVAAGLKITGQVATETNVRVDPKTKKKLVYIPPRIGSNMPGRWVPEDSAEAIAAQNSGELRKEDITKLQDRARNNGDGEIPTHP